MNNEDLLLIAGGAVVAYLLWENYSASSASTTTTAPGVLPTTSAASGISIAGPVTAGPNNSLQATVIINGVQLQVQVVANGDAFNPLSGQDITSQLAALGVVPAQVYALMAADYAPLVTPTIAPISAPTTPGTTNSLLPAPPPNWHPGIVGPQQWQNRRTWGPETPIAVGPISNNMLLQNMPPNSPPANMPTTGWGAYGGNATPPILDPNPPGHS
jgi:hypothetical protein